MTVHYVLQHVLPTGGDPRSCALYCCRAMSSSFGPPPPDHESARAEYETRLRAAFWALQELRRCIEQDPSDSEAEQMLDALGSFVAAKYGVAPSQVPADRVQRAQLARKYARDFWARNGGLMTYEL